jgi:hypothetical protein
MKNAILTAFLLCAAGAPAARAEGQMSPFLGSWTVTAAQIAPWYDGSGAKPESDPVMKGKTITFAAHAASGSPVVACTDTIYTVSTIEPETLFEGNLKNPAQDAKALGFKSGKILSLNEGCRSSTGDMELDFPMVDQDTLLLGLNNMVYTLKRLK